MKTKSNMHKQLLKYFLIVLLLVQQQVIANTPVTTPQQNDTIVINKTTTSRKYKVKIYPNASHEVLFFTASGENGKVYQLYIFDMEGRLIKQTQIRNKETTLLTNFTKGNYTFEVFSDDEKIENGTMNVK
jgi:Secretion system C-terminal sorting domain